MTRSRRQAAANGAPQDQSVMDSGREKSASPSKSQKGKKELAALGGDIAESEGPRTSRKAATSAAAAIAQQAALFGGRTTPALDYDADDVDEDQSLAFAIYQSMQPEAAPIGINKAASLKRKRSPAANGDATTPFANGTGAAAMHTTSDEDEDEDYIDPSSPRSKSHRKRRAPTAAKSKKTSAASLPPPQQQAPAVPLPNYPPQVLRTAVIVRTNLGIKVGHHVDLFTLLQNPGILATHPVAYQHNLDGAADTPSTTATGTIAVGGIACQCPQCSSSNNVIAPLEFESHAGSMLYSPAAHIKLTDADMGGISLADFLALVNSAELAANIDVHMDYCYTCKKDGHLLCCDGCTAAYHLDCVGVGTVPDDDWLCPLCIGEGRTKKQRLAAIAANNALSPKTNRTKSGGKAGRKSSIGTATTSGAAATGGKKRGRKPGSTNKQTNANKKGGGKGQAGTPSGRVHMVAPTAARRLNRPVRNLNRHKRLFEVGIEGGLKDGEKVLYMNRGNIVLEGKIVINPGGSSGILCPCCDKVVSCSQFESHAGHGQRRQPYENIYTTEGINLKQVAARLPADEPDPADGADDDVDGVGLDQIADGCRDVFGDLDTLPGGCVLCHDADFQRGPFGPRTMLLCDQCEQEFHVGCLKDAQLADMDSLPEGDWFCSFGCGRIHSELRQRVGMGLMEVPGHPNHTWQLLNGRDGTYGTTAAIKKAAEILQESFDPIMDLASNTDLLPLMLYAKQHNEWDYRNVYTLLLRYKNKPVVAATCRIFGPQMAELPLIATKTNARRQGHASLLVERFENVLQQAGVYQLVLPAAHETVETWKHGFGFQELDEDTVQVAKKLLRILVFPGTHVLYKNMPGVLPPSGHHVLELPAHLDPHIVGVMREMMDQVVKEVDGVTAVEEIADDKGAVDIVQPQQQQQQQPEEEEVGAMQQQEIKEEQPIPMAAAAAVATTETLATTLDMQQEEQQQVNRDVSVDMMVIDQ